MTERQNGTPIRGAIYARISSDPRDKHEGVDRQVADCKALAKTLGWNVIATFIDNDISAYSGVPRPAYREMLDGIRAGEIEGIIAWHTDRLHRRPTELEEFISVAESTNLQVRTVKAGELDLSTAGGRMVARMLGAAARGEIDHARERMQAAKDQAIKDGKFRGGPRPYGYESDGMTIREAEAKVIREATDGVLAGRTLAGIARDLNQRGLLAERKHKRRDAQNRLVKDAKGEPIWDTEHVPWDYGHLKEMLVRPRNAGLAAHGLPGRKTYRSLIDKKRHPVEIIGKAAWPAIVPEDQWRALVDLLTDPGRRNQNGNDTRWLGSGLYICGICGGKLRPAPTGGTKTRPYSRKYLYRCVESAHLTISTGPTDDYVKGIVAGYLRDPRIVAGMHPTDEHLTEDRKQRSVLAARLARFDTEHADGIITGALWASSTARVRAELAEVDARMTKALRRSTSSAIALANDPGQAFLDAPVDIQRAVMASIVKVKIISAKEAGVPVGGAWTDRRVVIEPIEAEPDPT